MANSEPADEHVPASDARARIREMLDGILQGKSYVFTRYGDPIARLSAVTSTEAKKK